LAVVVAEEHVAAFAHGYESGARPADVEQQGSWRERRGFGWQQAGIDYFRFLRQQCGRDKGRANSCF
jgi:hypothetical protein